MATTRNTALTSDDRVQAPIGRVAWGAIFAGAVIAVALMILFATLGVGIGAGVLNPGSGGMPGSGLGIGSVVYLIVTQLIALGAGGYVAALLSNMPGPITSALHGAAVWAIATVFLAWAAASGTGAMFGAVTSGLGSSASAAGNLGQAAIPDDFSLPDPTELASSISFDALPEELRSSLQEKGITSTNLKQETGEAFGNVFSEQERQAAMAQARQTLGNLLTSPGDAGEDISTFFDRLIEGEDAIVSQEDREEAMAVLQRRLDITPEEARGVVQSVEDAIGESIDTAQAAIEQAQAQAIDAAQAASKTVSTLALLLSFASLLGLAAAAAGAFAGKPDAPAGDLGARPA